MCPFDFFGNKEIWLRFLRRSPWEANQGFDLSWGHIANWRPWNHCKSTNPSIFVLLSFFCLPRLFLRLRLALRNRFFLSPRRTHRNLVLLLCFVIHQGLQNRASPTSAATFPISPSYVGFGFQGHTDVWELKGFRVFGIVSFFRPARLIGILFCCCVSLFIKVCKIKRALLRLPHLQFPHPI